MARKGCVRQKQFALVIGFLNADFCSEKSDVLDENRKNMLLKNTFKNRGTKGKRKRKKYFATVLS